MKPFRVPCVASISAAAQNAASKIPVSSSSIEQGQGNFAGCLFEITHRLLFGGRKSEQRDGSLFNHDLIMDEGWFGRLPRIGRTVDCKSKRRGMFFEPSYEASIAHSAGMGINQECDVYAFASVSYAGDVGEVQNCREIWFGGLIPKVEYLEGKDNVGEVQQEGDEYDFRNNCQVTRWNNLRTGAEFRKKGRRYDNNNFICQEDCWNRSYSYLEQYTLEDIPGFGWENLKLILAEAREQGWNENDMSILGQNVVWRQEAVEVPVTSVVNVKEQDCEVFIARPSKWGNPFIIGVHGSRLDVIKKYQSWIFTQPKLLADLWELKGKKLGCHCTPALCHGHFLAQLAEIPIGPVYINKDWIDITGVAGMEDSKIMLRTVNGDRVPIDQVYPDYIVNLL
jgi:hypothetical protein